MNSMDIHSKHHWDGPSGTCPTYDVRFTIPAEHVRRQEQGKDITPDDILNLRIALETLTIDQLMEVI